MTTAVDYLAIADALDADEAARERRDGPARALGEAINDFACRVATLTGYRITAIRIPGAVGMPVAFATATGTVDIEAKR